MKFKQLLSISLLIIASLLILGFIGTNKQLIPLSLAPFSSATLKLPLSIWIIIGFILGIIIEIILNLPTLIKLKRLNYRLRERLEFLEERLENFEKAKKAREEEELLLDEKTLEAKHKHEV